MARPLVVRPRRSPLLLLPLFAGFAALACGGAGPADDLTSSVSSAQDTGNDDRECNADEGDDASCAASPVARVPSAAYPTIQSALDSVASGSTILIASGTYAEALRVDGKTVRLVGHGITGAKKTTLAGASEGAGVVTFSNGGGGLVRGIALTGGAFGIAGQAGNSDKGTTPPGAVRVSHVSIASTGRGIFGQFPDLTVRQTTIGSTALNGASVATSKLFATQLTITNAGGVGILVLNYDAAGTQIVFDNVTANRNAHGGLEVQGGAVPVTVRSSSFVGNVHAGISLLGVANATLDDVHADLSATDADGTFGVGIVVQSSPSAAILNSHVALNAAYGIVNFASHVPMSGTHIIANPIDLDGENVNGAPYSFDVGAGGNVCENINFQVQPCSVLSSSLSPPMPLSQ
jgi:hypothetical protein